VSHTMSEIVIAVIDDEASLLDLMVELLTDEGYQVVPWTSAEGALDVLRVHRPALIVLDGWLEARSSGQLLLHAIRQEPTLRHVPIIVCSGDDGIVGAVGEREHQPVYGIRKPFQITDFLALVHTALSATRIP
jgi:DNA-binding NtrC family response regulator